MMRTTTTYFESLQERLGLHTLLLNTVARQKGVLELGRRIVQRESAKICPTPYDVVGQIGNSNLLYFAPQGKAPSTTPVLISPSLINRYYILDLMEGKSLIEFLVAKGNPVYCIDWGSPGTDEHSMGLEAFITGRLQQFLDLALAHSSTSKVHLFGHCLGGTMTTILATQDDSKLASLINLTTPISFHDDGILSAWTNAPFFNAQALAEAVGDVPKWISQPTFMSLRPMGQLSKWLRFYQKASDRDFLEFFHCMETWTSDNVRIPKRFYVELVNVLYRENALYEGTLEMNGNPVMLQNISVPILSVCAKKDHIVPLESARAGAEFYENENSQWVEFSGGHIGVVIGGKARHQLWPQLDSWLKDHGES